MVDHLFVKDQLIDFSSMVGSGLASWILVSNKTEGPIWDMYSRLE